MSANYNNNFDQLTINWDQNKIQKFMILLVLGYFSAKILKNYFDKPEIETSNIMPNFIIMVVMGWLLFIFTNIENRKLLGHLDNTNWMFYFGYIIGVSSPLIYNSFSKDNNIQNNKSIQYLFYALAFIIIVIMIYLSMRNSREYGNVLYYALYLIIIGIIILGTILSRQKSNMYSIQAKDKNGVLKSRGNIVYFSLPLMGWILSLLFMYDADENIFFKLLSFVNGITLGMFSGGIAFYGLPYVLQTQAENICIGDNECSRKGMILKNVKYEDINSTLSTIKWGLTITIIILIIVIILFYMQRF